MAEFNTNLWAPWRMDYIRALNSGGETGCFLCRYWADPSRDDENHVIWRSELSFAVMNRFPYANGHVMVALSAHQGEIAALTDGQLLDLGRNLRNATNLLRVVVQAQGFNVGYNVGQCAGAGLPGHLHAHVVPRWAGDTNYMAVLADTRVISDSLDALYRQLVDAARVEGLRT